MSRLWSPGARGPGLSVTTTTFVTRLQSVTSRNLHIAARSAHIEPPMVLGSQFVPDPTREDRNGAIHDAGRLGTITQNCEYQPTAVVPLHNTC